MSVEIDFVGLKHTKWIYHEDEPAQIGFLVVDELGEPVKDTDVKMKIERLVTKASRVKGAGSAYLTHYTDEWGVVSDGDYQSVDGPGVCEFIPSDPGSYRITASIQDTKKRTHSTQLRTWVAGKGQVVWRQPNDNSLEIIPEQEEYHIGDTARYLIKNPFPGANALITVERYGIMKHWIQNLESNTSIVEFQVTPDYLPGFYLSIVVTSPRVEEHLGEGGVDLGKPAFRIGYVSVPVKDPYKEIIVNVTPERDEYKPRDRVKVALRANPRNSDKKEPIELAIAVLDEAVFDMLTQGRDYYDPYKGFYRLDRLDLNNYGLLMRLVGLQEFEKKGANPGGGGGPDISMRSVFKFVSYWNPSLKTDKKGEATIEFEVPDNLTGWRIFAMAVTPSDRMGLGDKNFKVNRPTEIRPVMPNQVTQGDSFKGGFSIMNRTDKPRELSILMHVSGPIDSTETRPEYDEQITLDPYKRTNVWMPIKTKASGDLLFRVTAGDMIDGDRLEHIVPVKKRRSIETAATYGTTTADETSEQILFPKDIYSDVGDLSVVMSPTVIGNVKGAFQYMRNFPYTCWEQKLTKGVMASHYVNLKEYMPKEFQWEGSEKLSEETLSQAAHFQAPNGGIAYFVPLDIYASPYLSAYTALAFNWLRSSGYELPEQVEKRLHRYLENLLKKDVFPTFYSKGMSSTVRAVALAALAEHGRISLSDLERYHPHVPFMSLFGKAHYLQAAIRVDEAESIAKVMANQILAHSSQTGGKFFFNEEIDDSFKRILATPLRANAAILSALCVFGEKKEGADLIGDIPFKLVRGLTQARGNRDHWENTQENIFCMNPLIDYSRVYESESPKMTVKVFIDAQLLGKTEFADLKDDAVDLIRPIAEADLGKKAQVTIKRKGKGRLYYGARLHFTSLVEHTARINSGIEIRREYSVERDGEWILLNSPMEIKRGELIRVDIFLSLPTVRNFVVIDDPVPGGLEPVNRDLATASAVDADKGTFKASSGSWWFRFSDWCSYNTSRWSFYHREMRHDSVRFYSDYLPAGNYHVSYTAQAIASGKFVEMSVHAKEMYDPDVFGKGIHALLHVLDEVNN
ncbi:MAG: alpha-2-macroglobulin family protein [Thermodesulfobacteriota bacterium]|nr:alpha-2-macroglobulin family protein [Thermodesulfobacteriota bacterium]